MLRNLVLKNRSYRRFYQDEPISEQTLLELVDLARLTASGANLQPLKYVISNHSAQNKEIFKTLRWAGYLKDWDGPEDGERPAAYIVILKDLAIKKGPTIDEGIAAQSILLGAAEKGLGGCMFGSIDRERLSDFLELDDHFEIVLCIALGKPKEEVVIEEIKEGDVRYYRDEKDVHHVPKRPLDEIVIKKL